MGSGGSKEASSSRGRGGARKGIRFIQFGCLGSNGSDSDNQVSDHQKNISRSSTQCAVQIKMGSDGVKTECCRKVKIQKTAELPTVSSSAHHSEWDQTSISGSSSRTHRSPAQVSSNRPMNSSNSCRSRFNFIPGNISFRLSRASSLGSSRSYPISPPNLEILNDEELHLHQKQGRGLIDRTEARLGTNMLPSPFMSRSQGQLCENASGNLQLSTPVSNFSENMEVAETSSSVHHVECDSNSGIMGVDTILYPSRVHSETEATETRHSGPTGAREPIEQNFRFSRTLSVGRLRDRVLRRSSLSDIAFCPVQPERDTGLGSERQVWDGEIGAPSSEVNSVTSTSTPGHPASRVPISLFSIQAYETDTDQSLVSRYHDLLEHRSDFLERRRRIRSQVRALRRLGSRFENLSGHERSCILSGLHRTGRCTCHARSRNSNLNDETSARASISRIVMLAEALFEVLDDIHQQSVVLSSQPSISSIGSIPAPGDAVESLPVKFYTKSEQYQSDDAAQCYICLLEYEEGDSMRILPCHHEFHKACIDKWLKEIHRVCPLCRGDICGSDPLPADV